MNLRERGITVGDLLIVLIVIISAFFIIKQLKNDKESSLLSPSKVISINYKTLCSKMV